MALFRALQAAGIACISVTFDGAGDSGQIEDITAYDADNQQMVIPNEPSLVTEHVGFGSSINRSSRSCKLEQAIEELCYGFLEQTHGGWEINDGAYGIGARKGDEP